MPPAKRDDPYKNFNFHVEIDGVAQAAFSEVHLPTTSIEVIEYRDGSDVSKAPRKLPGVIKYNNLVLKRGLTLSRDLYQWFRRLLNGQADRRNLSIILLDDQRQPVVRWNVRSAWITKWEGPALNAKGNDVAIETMELAHEGIEQV